MQRQNLVAILATRTTRLVDALITESNVDRFAKHRSVLFQVVLWTSAFNSVVAPAIETVPVGNPGNQGWRGDPLNVGEVSYSYRIGKYEVTNAEYVEFLNLVDGTGANPLGLYNSKMSTSVFGGISVVLSNAAGAKYQVKEGRAKNPVVFVSFFDAIRFANWLHNEQGVGSTESGAYTILGGISTPSNAFSITREVSARWWVPSEDGWYKAGFHKNDGPTGNYWRYASSSDNFPYSVPPPGADAPSQSKTDNFFADDRIANGINNGYAVSGSPLLDKTRNYLTDVGAYSLSIGPYGTFDQGGNVTEWNELISPYQLDSRGFRGGYWAGGGDLISGFYRGGGIATAESQYIGFRVAAVIPEPTAMCIAITTFLCFASAWRKVRT